MSLPRKVPRLMDAESSASSSDSDGEPVLVEALDVGISVEFDGGFSEHADIGIGGITNLHFGAEQPPEVPEAASEVLSYELPEVLPETLSEAPLKAAPEVHAEEHRREKEEHLGDSPDFAARDVMELDLACENASRCIDVDLISGDVHQREGSDFEGDDEQMPSTLDDAWSTEAPEDSDEDDPVSTPSTSEVGSTSIDAGVAPELDCLFSGSPIKMEESLLAILSFYQSENLSGAGFSRLLKLIELLCPTPNKCPKTLEKLQSYFDSAKTPMESYYYCNNCLKNLNSLTDICNECSLLKPSVDQVIVLSLEDQLTQLYERPGFIDDIQYRFNRQKLHPNNLEDVYDGSIYKAEAESGVLRDKHNVSLQWNTDGASPFDSSSLQIWPFFSVVNELPPDKRFKRENLLLAAVFVGKGKPHPNILLKYVYPQVEKLKEGFSVKPDGFSEPITVKAVYICGTCDSPAKAVMFNQKYYNGFYSCPKCLSKGEKSDRTEYVFVHPYEEDLTPRTELEYEECASTAAVANVGLPKEKRISPQGIKGTTYLYLMVNLMIQSTAIDTLHCVYLGVTKQLLDLWFSKYYKHEPFSLYKVRKVVSHRLLSICPPHFVKRMPQSLEQISNWKGYEFLLMFFYYLLPALSGVMSQLYFHNFKLLVAGVSLLNQKSVSPSDIQEAEILLKQFVMDFQELYSLRHMSFNVHLLLHLSSVVKALGPLWCYSCFRFEDFNGKLLSLIHGSRHTGSQITSGIFLFLSLPRLLQNMALGKSRDYCHEVFNKGKKVKLNERVNNNCFSVGKYCKLVTIPEWMSNDLEQHQFNSAFTFERIKISNMVITSESYTKSNATCSRFVRYVHEGTEKYGAAKEFVKLSVCDCVKTCNCPGSFLAFVTFFNSEIGFKTTNPPCSIRYIQKCVASENVEAVPISCIQNVCFYIETSSEFVYLCNPLNDMEMYN